MNYVILINQDFKNKNIVSESIKIFESSEKTTNTFTIIGNENNLLALNGIDNMKIIHTKKDEDSVKIALKQLEDNPNYSFISFVNQNLILKAIDKTKEKKVFYTYVKFNSEQYGRPIYFVNTSKLSEESPVEMNEIANSFISLNPSKSKDLKFKYYLNKEDTVSSSIIKAFKKNTAYLGEVTTKDLLKDSNVFILFKATDFSTFFESFKLAYDTFYETYKTAIFGVSSKFGNYLVRDAINKPAKMYGNKFNNPITNLMVGNKQFYFVKDDINVIDLSNLYRELVKKQ